MNTMRYRSTRLTAVATAAMLAAIVIFPGCSGLKWWQQGRYFKTSVARDFKPADDQRIAVYVFSEGEAIDGTDRPTDAFDIAETIISVPLMLLGGGIPNQTQIGISPAFYPDPITASAIFEPDTSNAGPSLELASAIREELNSRGFSAAVVTDLGHSGEIPLKSVLKDAKDKGYEQALVVYYSGLRKWTQYAGTETYSRGRNTVVQTNVNQFNGFLFLPNAALLNTSNGRQLWSSSYYGLVENAHIINFSGEPFVKAVTDRIIVNGADDYMKAAVLAARSLFEPTAWTLGVAPFPGRGERKTKM